MTSPWSIDALELDRYLASVDVPREPPGLEALGRLQEAHVRRYTFDNIDVLLGNPPRMDLGSIQEKFVGRGRGGYCYEHMTLLAAVMQALGYPVQRHLGRVMDAANSRSHMTVVTQLEGRRWMVDAGFGFSATAPVLLEDGAVTEAGGWQWRMEASGQGAALLWELSRSTHDGWAMMHATDELPVTPKDVGVANFFNSTSPDSVFTGTLQLMRHLPDRHVAVIGRKVTTRRPGRPTEQHELGPGELRDLLGQLAPGVTAEETEKLVRQWG